MGDKGDAPDVKGDFLTRIDGASVQALEMVSASVLPKLVARVRPESRKLIKIHHEAGRDTWIVSAAPHEVVEPLARSLGMTGAIGTRGKVLAGHYTGELDGPFVYGAGKVDAIEKIAADLGYDLERSYAYSDSISDLPMMESVGHPVAVNPDSELDSIAHERGWPVVIFARKTKRALAASAVGTLAVSAALASYALGRRHGRSTALAQIARAGDLDPQGLEDRARPEELFQLGKEGCARLDAVGIAQLQNFDPMVAGHVEIDGCRSRMVGENGLEAGHHLRGER